MNSKILQRNIISVLFIFTLFMLQACTGYSSYSKIARAGDTISIPVGSPVGMTKDPANTTAVYVPDSGGSIPLTIRSVFNLYPDKKSRLNLTSTVDALVDSADHEAWQTVMVIDLPASIPVGMGQIQITSIADYPGINSHINNFPVALEIIGGTGGSDAFTYEFGIGASSDGDLEQLEPLPHALITPPVNNDSYAAIEMRITLDTTAASLDDAKVRVIVDDMTSTTLSNKSVVWRVTPAGELYVILMSTSGNLQARESRFSIVTKPKFSFNAVPVITDVKYYDVDGNLVDQASGAPVVSDYTVALY